MAKAPKMILPAADFDVPLEAGKMKAVTSVATEKGTEYMVPVESLRVIPGFNVRVRETDDYRAHLESLKQSIRENGFYSNKPLAGYIAKDGADGEDVIYITDGHTRLEAVQEINAEDVDGTSEIASLPIILKAADSNLADLTIALVQDNNGRQLTPYEMGVVVKRLAGMKDAEGNALYSKGDIARKLSVTERYIDDLNVLVDAPAKVRTAVLEGSVSSTLAIQELRKNPKKAEERIAKAVEKVKALGKKKATKKDIGTVRMVKTKLAISLATGDTMGTVLKSLAKQIREKVAVGEENDDLLTDGTLTVVLELPATEDEAPVEKPAKVEKPSKKAKADKAAKKDGKKAKADKPKKGKKAEAEPEVTSEPVEEDGEPAKLPPKVAGDANDDPDDI
jgi:ParB family transcriptional regulator, chromosome partitioning protein